MFNEKAKEMPRKSERTLLFPEVTRLKDCNLSYWSFLFVLLFFYLLVFQFYKLIGDSLTTEKVMIVSHFSGSRF